MAVFTAMSGAFSSAFGTPKSTITQSPMNLSMCPPWALMTASIIAKHAVHDAGHFLRVHLLAHGREAGDVGEHHRGQAAFGFGNGFHCFASGVRGG